jgi:hypothetical protein
VFLFFPFGAAGGVFLSLLRRIFLEPYKRANSAGQAERRQFLSILQ